MTLVFTVSLMMMMISSSTRAPASSSAPALVGQDEGVLHSVLQDIREWRVSSTVVDDPSEGERIDLFYFMELIHGAPFRAVYQFKSIPFSRLAQHSQKRPEWFPGSARYWQANQ